MRNTDRSPSCSRAVRPLAAHRDAALLVRLPDCEILHRAKGYDANAIRRQVEERSAMPNIPPKANRKRKNCFSPFLLSKPKRH
jgi:hypothetical protein